MWQISCIKIMFVADLKLIHNVCGRFYALIGSFSQNWQITSLNWQFFSPKLADFCPKFLIRTCFYFLLKISPPPKKKSENKSQKNYFKKWGEGGRNCRENVQYTPDIIWRKNRIWKYLHITLLNWTQDGSF